MNKLINKLSGFLVWFLFSTGFSSSNSPFLEQDGSVCSITYSDSRKQTVEASATCKHLLIINSGSGMLLVSSPLKIDHVLIVNKGSNYLDLTRLKAIEMNLEDRGSGTINIKGTDKISGTSRGSGTILLDKEIKGDIKNQGSGCAYGAIA